jgi:hypothetical protein
VRLDRVQVCNFATGVQVDACQEAHALQLQVRGCSVGLDLLLNSNQNTFVQTDIAACGTGLRLDGAVNNGFFGGAIQGCSLYGVHLRNSAEENAFENFYFENTAVTYAIYLQGGDINVFDKVHLSGTANAVQIASNYNRLRATKAGGAITLASGTSGNVIEGPFGTVTDSGSGNIRQYFDGDGWHWIFSPGSTGTPALTLSGAPKAFLNMATVGGKQFHLEVRDDIGASWRLQDQVNNKTYLQGVAGTTPTVAIGPSGTGIARHLSATATWDPPSVAAGAQATTTVTVTNAALGDTVVVGFNKDLQGMMLTGYVSTAGTVTVVLRNDTAGGARSRQRHAPRGRVAALTEGIAAAPERSTAGEARDVPRLPGGRAINVPYWLRNGSESRSRADSIAGPCASRRCLICARISASWSATFCHCTSLARYHS